MFSNPLHLAVIGLACLCVFMLAERVMKWVYTKDAEVEKRRRTAFHLAGVLKQYGLTRMPDILGDYAVGDYSGMYDKLHDFGRLSMSGDEAVMAEFDQVFQNVMSAKLGTEEGRTLMAAKLSEAMKAAEALAASAPVNMKVPV